MHKIPYNVCSSHGSFELCLLYMKRNHVIYYTEIRGIPNDIYLECFFYRFDNLTLKT